jgi:hypothetical protein
MDNGAHAGGQLAPLPSRFVLVPALVAASCDQACGHFLEFFAANGDPRLDPLPRSSTIAGATR